MSKWTVGESITGGDLPNHDTDIFVQIREDGYGMVALVDGTPIDDPEVMARPDFIVRACNSHEALLRATVAMFQAFTRRPFNEDERQHALLLAKNAIDNSKI